MGAWRAFLTAIFGADLMGGSSHDPEQLSGWMLFMIFSIVATVVFTPFWILCWRIGMGGKSFKEKFVEFKEEIEKAKSGANLQAAERPSSPIIICVPTETANDILPNEPNI
ncbi:hypothetical protein HDE_10675 [Halotydeus destructor]|nr:hypothetical protein HDE_10675 [Halotydeus destructor]